MDDLEKKIIEEANSYQIKTTGNNILNTYKSTKKEHKFHIKPIFIGFSICFASAALILGMVILLNPSIINPIDNVKPTLSTKETDLLKNEVGLLGFNLDRGSGSNLGMKFRRSLDLEGDLLGNFKKYVDNFEVTFPSFYYIDDNLDDEIVVTTIDLKEPLKIGDDTFTQETSYLDKDNNLLYKTYINYKNVKEIENDKSSYEFSSITKENSYSFEINSENEDPYEIKLTNDSEYEYVVEKVVLNNYLIKIDDFSFYLLINISNKTRIYSSSGLENISFNF